MTMRYRIVSKTAGVDLVYIFFNWLGDSYQDLGSNFSGAGDFLDGVDTAGSELSNGIHWGYFEPNWDGITDGRRWPYFGAQLPSLSLRISAGRLASRLYFFSWFKLQMVMICHDKMGVCNPFSDTSSNSQKNSECWLSLLYPLAI